MPAAFATLVGCLVAIWLRHAITGRTRRCRYGALIGITAFLLAQS